MYIDLVLPVHCICVFNIHDHQNELSVPQMFFTIVSIIACTLILFFCAYCDFNTHDHQRSEATNGLQPTMGSRLERLNDFKLGRSGISLFDLNFVITWTRQVNSYFSSPCSSIKVLPVCGKKKCTRRVPMVPERQSPVLWILIEIE